MCLVALVVLVVVIVRLDRAAKDLRRAATDFRAEAEPALAELAEVVRTADFELDRVDAIVSGAEHISGRVDAASDLAYRTFTNPVVKALAVGTGTRPRRPTPQGRQAHSPPLRRPSPSLVMEAS